MPEPEAEGRPDPYALRPGDPHPGRTPDPAGSRQPYESPHQVDPAARRRVRNLALLSGLAAVLAVAAGPVGLILGIATLVLAYRRRGDSKRAGLSSLRAALPVAGGLFAVVVGGLVTIFLVMFNDELRDYQECMAGANTRVAEDNCQDELVDELESRFGLG